MKVIIVANSRKNKCTGGMHFKITTLILNLKIKTCH